MRSKLVLAGLLMAAVSVSGVALGQSDSQAIKPASTRLSQAGNALLGQGKPAAAIDQYETALAVDPRNSAAFIGMARASQALGLPGKAVKYYREALSLDPNDLTALEEQGKALVERGATARANVNLVRLRELCQSDCVQAQRLAAVIAKGPPRPQTAISTTPANVNKATTKKN